jgi:hypothetical protein
MVGLFETLLVTLSMLRVCPTYGGELINEDSMLRYGCLKLVVALRQQAASGQLNNCGKQIQIPFPRPLSRS